MNHKTKLDQSDGPAMEYLLIIMVVSVVSHFQTLDHSRNYSKLVFDVSFTMIWGVGSRTLCVNSRSEIANSSGLHFQWSCFKYRHPSRVGNHSVFFLICPTWYTYWLTNMYTVLLVCTLWIIIGDSISRTLCWPSLFIVRMDCGRCFRFAQIQNAKPEEKLHELFSMGFADEV